MPKYGVQQLIKSSPRTWRCFPKARPRHGRGIVFSTYVEVFPSDFAYSLPCSGLLHVRGGVSYLMGSPLQAGTSSPRTWRCFHGTNAGDNGGWVFSTYVEVFPIRTFAIWSARGLLHVRGGVSSLLLSHKKQRPVFSTYVEVFLLQLLCNCCSRSLLHVRGGVSAVASAVTEKLQSSPRTWRCFPLQGYAAELPAVFSTYVEVFLNGSVTRIFKMRLLHVRGGVSNIV